MIQVGFKSNKGVRRANNEDAYFVVPSENVYIVADGVGGNKSGEIASRTAVSCIAEYVRENPIKKIKKETELKKYFMDCMDMANKRIYSLAFKHPQNRGMATTALVAYVAGNSAYIVNVGDSRAYICRDRKLSCITVDHTYVNTLLQQNIITQEEAETHDRKHMITRAVGGDAVIEPDFFRIDIQSGDILLLCTDGLYNEVHEDIIAETLSRPESMQDIANELVDKANRCGGRDNITLVCLKI